MAGETRRKCLVPGFEVTSDDTLVDVGCGPGWASRAAGEVGADVIAVDTDRGFVERLTEDMKTIPARSFQGIVSDSEAIPVPDGVATAVVCTEVLEHVDDPGRFLAELARIGKPGARYLITVPDHASETVLKIVAPPLYWAKPNHQHIFSHEQLEEMVKAAGLEVEGRSCRNFYGSMWWLLNWTTGDDPGYWPGSTKPRPPAVADFERLWETLLASPRGGEVIEALDPLFPKSYAVVARKAAAPALRVAPTPRWKRHLKDGGIRLGRFDIRWKVRRTPAA